MADMCIIGEPTGLQLQIGNSGLLWARVSVDGRATKFVLAACKMAQAIQDWEKEYQRKYPHKFMLPTVQIGAIEGGNPFKPGTRPTTDIFVIVKMLPNTPPLAIKREIEQVCEKVRKREPDILDVRVDLYLTTPGYEISKSEYVVKAMERAHRVVFNKPVPYPQPIRYGITSDGSRYAQYGVPSITYGPGFGTHLIDPTDTKAGEEWDSPSGVRRGWAFRIWSIARRSMPSPHSISATRRKKKSQSRGVADGFNFCALSQSVLHVPDLLRTCSRQGKTGRV